MRKTLIMDEGTREMRLRYDAEVWLGNHERTEYRVVDARIDGDVVRNLPHLNGLPVFGDGVTHLVRLDRWHDRAFWTQPRPVQDTVKTPCPKAANARRKCELCAELAS